MKYALTLLPFLLGVHFSFAQYENVWIFGNNAGIDFNSGLPVPIKSNVMGFGEAAASVCDAQGQLLFYTEGDMVWDKHHNLMPNGKNLTGLMNPRGGSPTASSAQGALIVPMPGINHKYYIFSLSSNELKYPPPNGDSSGFFYYSIVDMNLNGGLGDIEVGKKGILIGAEFTEMMTSVQGTRCNVWIIAPSRNPANIPQFKAFEITESGINLRPVLSTATGNTEGATVGKIIISPNSQKIAVSRRASGGVGLPVELYDFDRATGVILNQIKLSIRGLASDVSFYGACFSPNNSKLYVNQLRSGVGAIYQYNLSESNTEKIVESFTFIDSASFTDIKRAEGGKIYYIADEESNKIGIIHQPDAAGRICQPEHNAIQLLSGTGVHLGLPHVLTRFTRDSVYSKEQVAAACFASSVSIQVKNPTGNWNLTWNNGQQSATITIDTPGVYWASYYAEPCIFQVDTFDVSFSRGVLPHFAIQSSCIRQANGSIDAQTYRGDTVAYFYTWKDKYNNVRSQTHSITEAAAGDYTVHIRTHECDTTITLTIPEENHLASFLVDTLVCSQEEVGFNNTSDRYYTHFRWSFGDSSHSELEQPSHRYLVPGQYKVMLSASGEKCSDTMHQVITIDPRFQGNLTSDKDSICKGETIVFKSTLHPNALKLRWNFGDGGEMSSLNDDGEIQHSYTTTGLVPMSLKITSRACPDTTLTKMVKVFALPEVYLGADSSLCYHGAAIALRNLLPASQDFREYYVWSTGDTTESITADHPGKYTLTLSRDPLGCSTTETITVRNDCYIDIPNAFTPNGDGVNDYFFPRQLLTKGIISFHMMVLNRWGQTIFETTNREGRGWDGQFNGNQQPLGVYVYKIVLTMDQSVDEIYQGNVTLIR